MDDVRPEWIRIVAGSGQQPVIEGGLVIMVGGRSAIGWGLALAIASAAPVFAQDAGAPAGATVLPNIHWSLSGETSVRAPVAASRRIRRPGRARLPLRKPQAAKDGQGRQARGRHRARPASAPRPAPGPPLPSACAQRPSRASCRRRPPRRPIVAPQRPDRRSDARRQTRPEPRVVPVDARRDEPWLRRRPRGRSRHRLRRDGSAAACRPRSRGLRSRPGDCPPPDAAQGQRG